MRAKQKESTRTLQTMLRAGLQMIKKTKWKIYIETDYGALAARTLEVEGVDGYYIDAYQANFYQVSQWWVPQHYCLPPTPRQ